MARRYRMQFSVHCDLRTLERPADLHSQDIKAAVLCRFLWWAITLLLLGTLSSLATTNLSTWVFPGASGRLNYRADYLGNRILDASGVGYKGESVPLPSSNTAPVKVSISPVAGDNTANIQNAINQVAAMSLDGNGFRGAVLLNAGAYPCSNTLTISASGVVLRGVGSSTNGTGTVLQATASNA